MTIPALISQPFGNPLNAVNLLRDLSYLNPFAYSPSGLLDRIPLDCPDLPRYTVNIPATDFCTNAFVCVTGSAVLVLVAGTNGDQVPNLLSTWISGSVDSLIPGVNLTFAQAARYIKANISLQWLTQGQDWFLAGHSFGGAIVEVLARIVQTTFNPNSLTVWTFGAPRPGDAVFQDSVDQVNLFRYFNDTDPVPEVPPHTPEAPLLHFALPNRVAANLNRQVQPNGGIRVAQNGSFTYTNEQTLPLSINEPSLLAWALGSQCFSAQAHAPTEYANRLALAAQSVSVSPPMSINRNPIPPEPEVDLTVRDIGRLIDQAVDRLPQPVPAGLPTFTPQAGKSPPRATIHHHRAGWGVWYAGSMVQLMRTKREARAAARSINAANRATTRLTAT